MQANAITLNVDYLNNSTTTAEVYDRADYFQNRSTYHGANHASDSRDIFQLYRTYPKQNGNFKGVEKCSIKFTYDHSVDGVDGVATLTSPAIAEINFSLPVGMTAAEKLIVRQRVISILDDDTVMDDLMVQQLV